MTALLVAAAVAKAALAWALFGLPELVPDTGLYAAGGLGIFPSPLGRLVGIGGTTALGVFNVAANGVLVWAVIRLAGRVHAGAIALVSPLGVWSIFAGMDTIAAALLVLAAQARARGRVSLELAAVGFHPAAALVVVASRGRRRIISAGFAVGGLALLLATPYRTAITELDPLIVVTAAIATAGVYAVTFGPFVHRLRAVAPAIAGGALAAGLVAAKPWETNCRYMLPAVALGAAHVVRGAGS